MSDDPIAQMKSWNQRIIAEFRDNGGKVGGDFEGATLLLLHSTGARSGKEHVNPIVYRPLGDRRMAVFASYAGAPRSPDWYHNLRAHPETTVEVGTETVAVTARQAEGSERDEIWSAQKSEVPQFAEYEKKTDREIPVIVLEPR